MPVGHTTLPACSRDVGNYNPLADRPASRRGARPASLSPDSPTARAGRGTHGAQLASVPPSPANGIGAALSQSPGSARKERFRQPAGQRRGAEADHSHPASRRRRLRPPRRWYCFCPAAGSGAAGEWPRTAAGADAACAGELLAGPRLEGKGGLWLHPAAPRLAMRANGPQDLFQILVVASRP